MAGLIDARVFGGPVVFVAETPEEDAGVVVVLGDHVAERAAAHLFEDVAAYSAAAPGISSQTRMPRRSQRSRTRRDCW